MTLIKKLINGPPGSGGPLLAFNAYNLVLDTQPNEPAEVFCAENDS
jgi:hypothetical protein